jgi:glycosyltransferase involved in cell wall biosynthesis
MKIAIFLESFQPEYWGGRETRWKNLIDFFSGSNELLIYGDFSQFSSDVAFPGVQAKFVNIGPLPPMYGPKGNRSLKHAILYTFKAYKVLSSKSDILLTDQTPLISIPVFRLFAFVSRTQLSITWHEVWSAQTWFRYSRIMGIFGVFIQEMALLFSKNIVVPSAEVAVDLQKRLISRKPTVIANGVKPNLQRRKVNQSQQNDPAINLLFVGRLIKHKNCDFLIDIMERAINLRKNWKMTIIGIGPLEFELKKLVADKNLVQYITFKSNIPEIDLLKEYSISDVFVFPSQREGYGISVAEAISQDLPVIVYDCPENASTSLVQTKVTGLKIEKLDVAIWIAAIEELMNNRDRSQFQDQTEIASWESIGNEYSDFLAALVRPSNVTVKNQV